MRLKCEVPYQYCSNSQLHCCSVQWGLSSITVWHILEQACFCLVITPIRLNVWSRYQVVIVVDLLNMKDFDTYEALFITLPVVFIALVIFLLIYSQKRRKVSSLSTICDHSSLSQVYHFCICFALFLTYYHLNHKRLFSTPSDAVALSSEESTSMMNQVSWI